jgi:quercetin dioxygenase-like cupin family protein
MSANVQAAIACADLEAAMAAYETHGFRLDMITPADAPRLALMSADGVQLKLEAERVSDTGRAGMLYRDLIPGRLGGRVIASHIRIPDGGPVPDNVHYHHVRFQMIYCAKGWVRVVYEDQGEPFVMREGDCVLQPPGIRHRVLESSPGLEVIEVTAPAEHETWRDHDMTLPQPIVRANRDYSGQRFVRHIAAEAPWRANGQGFDVRDTGIATATKGDGSVEIWRARGPASADIAVDTTQTAIIVALNGALKVDVKPIVAGEAHVLPSGTRATMSTTAGELLLIKLNT